MDVPTLPPEVVAVLPEEVKAFIVYLVDEIARLRSEVFELKAINAELRAWLDQNSSNSSKPPSSDPPCQKPAPKKESSGQRPGGQPGHPRHARPLRKATKVVDPIPHACGECGCLLLGYDLKPMRHQVVELPVLEPEVTDYLLHRLTCLGCGAANGRARPARNMGRVCKRRWPCSAVNSG